MLRWLGYLLLLVLVIAFITSPSEEKFSAFIDTEMKNAACRPYIKHQAYGLFFLKAFSISSAKECKEIKKLKSLQTGTGLKTDVGVPVYGDTHTYLGLFGRFWKL